MILFSPFFCSWVQRWTSSPPARATWRMWCSRTCIRLGRLMSRRTWLRTTRWPLSSATPSASEMFTSMRRSSSCSRWRTYPRQIAIASSGLRYVVFSGFCFSVSGFCTNLIWCFMLSRKLIPQRLDDLNFGLSSGLFWKFQKKIFSKLLFLIWKNYFQFEKIAFNFFL